MVAASGSYLDRALVEHVRSRRWLLWAVLHALLGGVLCFVPLFDVLGFEYAFVFALLVSFASADLAATYVRRAREANVHPVERRASSVRALAGLLGHAVLAGGGLLAVPLLLVVANALRVRQCDWIQGGAFYALLPCVSVVFGSTAGVVASLVLAARRRLQVAATWLIVAGSILYGVFRFWAAPPIFGYDPFVGYFPGSVYDEHIQLGAPFFWSRLYQLCFTGAALAACAAFLDVDGLAVRRRPVLRGPAVAAIALVVAAALLGASSADLGYAVSAGDIARTLGGRHETAHFVIYYPENPDFARRIEQIGRDHEYRYAQVTRAFGAEPGGKITSFYFASAEDKQRWMGAGATYIAKPWRREIYVQHDEFPHDVLRHEIAHVVAGAFGDPLFHVSVAWTGWPPARFNVGLIEGAAVAADWPTRSGRMTPHQAARAMLDLGMLPPVGRLLAPGFLQFSSATSYTTAGSFCYFLLSRYGPEKFRRIYRTGGPPDAFAAVYGKPLSTLEEEWHGELRATSTADDDREIARERFRRPGIFARPCPHAVARRLARAGEFLGRGKAADAVDVLRHVCRDDPGEPSHRLALAGALSQTGRNEEAAQIYQEIADGGDTYSTPLRARALVSLLDLHGRRGDVAAARQALGPALALPVDENTRRGLAVRALALEKTFPAAAALRDYLFADPEGEGEPDLVLLVARAHRVIADAPADGIGEYLMGRLLTSRGAPADAAFHLQRAQSLGLSDPLVARENDRLLAASAFLLADYSTVRQAAARLQAASQPLAVQLEGKDWVERCTFAETGHL